MVHICCFPLGSIVAKSLQTFMLTKHYSSWFNWSESLQGERVRLKITSADSVLKQHSMSTQRDNAVYKHWTCRHDTSDAVRPVVSGWQYSPNLTEISDICQIQVLETFHRATSYWSVICHLFAVSFVLHCACGQLRVYHVYMGRCAVSAS